MENKTVTPDQPQPVPAPITAVPGKKKISPWVWVLSGCAILIILGFATMAFLGWLGYQAAKEEINKQAPGMKEFKERIDSTNKEAERWSQEAEKLQKKSQELQEAMPTLEDINSAVPQRQ